MKKTLSLALVVLMVVACFAVFAVNASADDGYTFADGVLTVTKDIEAAKEEYPWFSVKADITKVVIADGVTKVGKFSFSEAAGLKEVVIGKDVKEIGADAFSYIDGIDLMTFAAPIEKIGQGIVYSTPVTKVVLNGQSEAQFKAIASVAPYNVKDGGGFENAVFEVNGDVDEKVTLTIVPMYGVLENWSGGTFFIVGGTNKDLVNVDDLAPAEGKAKRTVYVTIKDETDNKTYYINGYKFDNPSKEIYSSGAFLRIAPTYYGITPYADHRYTITLKFFEGTKLVAEGTSAEGAFNDANAAFKSDGPIVPDPVPNQYENEEVLPAAPVDPPIDPPVAGEYTVVLAVLAVVALFGTAVIVSKKVRV